ncbi:actin-related protein 5-like [Branchiostoma lanceolatum]|uniref:actin-related protein 5-like n=1 Tax=Branchiostoma lanceolatum TaxID=7740 RepID=UPI0034544DF2
MAAATNQEPDHPKAVNVFTFKDVKTQPDSFFTYPESLRGGKTPLIIDNGSYQCKAGWASDKEPRLIFKNVMAKGRGKKETDVQIGNDISNIEVVRWLLKTQFDGQVVTHYDMQEQMFDYLFSHLGISTEGCVEHPVVMTEAVCNPNYCRQNMSELLFECYRVPKVAYGVDALFSLHHNRPKAALDHAMLVCSGFHTTHILPLVGSRLDAANCKRINLGGWQATGYMHRLFQLKYPAHFAAITLTRSEELLYDHGYIAVDYMDELQRWSDLSYYHRNVHKIQLPFTPLPTSSVSAEDKEKRKQQAGRRLQEINAKRREQKLAAEQEKLQQLLSIQELMEDDDDDSFLRALEECGFSSANELQVAINKLSLSIQRTKEKMLQPEEGQPSRATPELDKQQRAEREAIVGNLRRQRQEIVETRQQRRQRRQEVAKRKSHAAQERMKILTQLAQSERRRGKEDTFGMNEEDWNVYKAISKEGDSDSEQEQERLNQIDQLLREHDPDFEKDFGNGQDMDVTFDIAEYYQLHLGVERCRVPELLFQPSLLGMDQAGVTETMDYVLNKYPADVQDKLMQNVFLTGGNTLYPNLQARMERELQAIRPFQSTFQVFTAKNAVLDPWLGARSMSVDPSRSAQMFLTRAEYLEKGAEYLKEHRASNIFIPTPK